MAAIQSYLEQLSDILDDYFITLDHELEQASNRCMDNLSKIDSLIDFYDQDITQRTEGQPESAEKRRTFVKLEVLNQKSILLVMGKSFLPCLGRHTHEASFAQPSALHIDQIMVSPPKRPLSRSGPQSGSSGGRPRTALDQGDGEQRFNYPFAADDESFREFLKKDQCVAGHSGAGAKDRCGLVSSRGAALLVEATDTATVDTIDSLIDQYIISVDKAITVAQREFVSDLAKLDAKISHFDLQITDGLDQQVLLESADKRRIYVKREVLMRKSEMIRVAKHFMVETFKHGFNVQDLDEV